MRTIQTATGKTILLCHALIYLREGYFKTIEYLPKERQQNRMIGFNIGLLKGTK